MIQTRIKSVGAVYPVTVRFIDENQCMVYLPKDVEGLAIMEPDSHKNLRIVAREKTPYFSKAKREESDDDVDAKVSSPMAVSDSNSNKRPFSRSTEMNRERPEARNTEASGYSLLASRQREPGASLTYRTGQSIGKKNKIDERDIQSQKRNQASLTEIKPTVNSSKEDDHLLGFRSQIKASQNYSQGTLREKDAFTDNLDHQGLLMKPRIDAHRDESISLDHPRSITDHVRAIRDPNPDNPDKKFTQLYMDDGFKKKFGTKLALTPNKVFGNNDSADVKKGTS